MLLGPYAKRSAFGLGPASIASRPVELTAPMKSIAKKSSPLPRKTVENRRSSPQSRPIGGYATGGQ